MFGKVKTVKDNNRSAHRNYAAFHDNMRRRFIFFGPYPFMGTGRDTGRAKVPKLYGDNQRLR